MCTSASTDSAITIWCQREGGTTHHGFHQPAHFLYLANHNKTMNYHTMHVRQCNNVACTCMNAVFCICTSQTSSKAIASSLPCTTVHSGHIHASSTHGTSPTGRWSRSWRRRWRWPPLLCRPPWGRCRRNPLHWCRPFLWTNPRPCYEQVSRWGTPCPASWRLAFLRARVCWLWFGLGGWSYRYMGHELGGWLHEYRNL